MRSDSWCARADARPNDGLDAAANVEVPNDLHPARLRDLRDVVENAVDCALVEDSVIAKAPEVELEALQLDAESPGTYVM